MMTPQLEADVPPEICEQPIRQFAMFFRGYNVSLSLLIGAIPVPIALWDLIPIFASTKSFLTLTTSVGCYLAVGFIFSQRTAIAQLYFPRRPSGVIYARERRRSRSFSLVPLVLALMGLSLFSLYVASVNSSIEQVAYEHAIADSSVLKTTYTDVCVGLPSPADLPSPKAPRLIAAHLSAFGITSPLAILCQWDNYGTLNYQVRFQNQDPVIAILKETPGLSVPNAIFSGALFLGAFLCVTCAFILMGLREYIQQTLNISDFDTRDQPLTHCVRFDIDGAPGLYGQVEFSLEDSNLRPLITGPLCIWHNRIPKAEAIDREGRVTRWYHPSEGLRSQEWCQFSGVSPEGELQRRLTASTKRIIDEYMEREMGRDGAPRIQNSGS